MPEPVTEWPSTTDADNQPIDRVSSNRSLASAPPIDEASGSDPDLAVSVNDVSVTFEAMADRQRRSKLDIGRLIRSREARHVQALRGVSLELRTGDALGLVGHNGAGKSTLMHTIAGFIQPSSGEVLVRSQPQMLGVQATLNQRLSGRANIEMGLLALGAHPDRLPDLTEEIISVSNLGAFIDLPIKSYSTGMRLRLGFAISTVRTPDILIIDEALAVGDKVFKKQSHARLDEIRENAGVVILASHSLPEIRRTCNRVLWLDAGKIVDWVRRPTSSTNIATHN